MVAQALGKLLHMVGILPTDKVTEVQRTDLVGEFVGHTGPKTRRKVCLFLAWGFIIASAEGRHNFIIASKFLSARYFQMTLRV